MVTFDGLRSGLNTTQLIDSLMSLERIPQTQLQTRRQKVQSAAAAYRSINTRVDALRTAAEALTKATTWSAAKATSGSPNVTATLGATPTTGSLTFKVMSISERHSVLSAKTYTSTADASGFGNSLTLTNADGSNPRTITVGGTQTLSDTVKAINESGYGLSATAVQISPGQYQLQVTAKDSGAAKAFKLASDTDFRVVTQGADAELSVGSTSPFSVFSSTDEFKDLMPGVTLKVTKADTTTPVTVSVEADPEAVAKSVQSLIDAANGALDEIRKHSAASSSSAGVLAGDFGLNKLSSDLLQAVSNAVGTLGSAGYAGIELSRSGKIEFDKTAFSEALSDNPDKVRGLLEGTPASDGPDGTAGTADDVAAVKGVAARLLEVAKGATDKQTGFLTTAAQGRDDLADDLQDKIEGWDVRLEKRRASLQRQYAALEVALSRMQSQSSWLAGQIGSLPQMQS